MKRHLWFFSLLFLCYVSSQAQTITITGTVNDQSGRAVPFATVSETGTGNSTVADSAGRFTLRTQTGARITVTAAGF